MGETNQQGLIPPEKLNEIAVALGRALGTMLSAVCEVFCEALKDPEVQEALNVALQRAEEIAKQKAEKGTPPLLPAHGQHSEECIAITPDCPCNTCRRDYQGNEDTLSCCGDHALDCGFKECPDYMAEGGDLSCSK